MGALFWWLHESLPGLKGQSTGKGLDSEKAEGRLGHRGLPSSPPPRTFLTLQPCHNQRGGDSQD